MKIVDFAKQVINQNGKPYELFKNETISLKIKVNYQKLNVHIYFRDIDISLEGETADTKLFESFEKCIVKENGERALYSPRQDPKKDDYTVEEFLHQVLIVGDSTPLATFSQGSNDYSIVSKYEGGKLVLVLQSLWQNGDRKKTYIAGELIPNKI